ncbi:MAG TPA: YibE/F family protein [Lactobacillaceae bacterium]|jgi:uncharacterized membrane protein
MQVRYRLLFVIMAALLTYVGLTHDAAIYQQPVGQITHVQTTKRTTVTDEHDNQDTQVTQVLTIKLLNRAGQVRLTNQTEVSQAFTPVYRVGQQVLLTHQDQVWRVGGLKRDAVIGALLVFVFGLFSVFSRWRAFGLLSASLLVNLSLFAGAVWLDIHLEKPAVLGIFATLAVFVAAVALIFVLGWTWQMLVALVATVVSTALTASLSLLILNLTQNAGVHFETLTYVTQNPETLFLSMAIIGLLGAVMDEAADIVAAVFGMARQETHTWREFYTSGVAVGRDIMGTLINVLFMLFAAETFAMVLLTLRNGNDWSYVFEMVLNLGIVQTLISAIGIVLAIPLTSAMAATILVRVGGGRHD